VVDDVDSLGGARDRCRVAEISVNRLEAAGPWRAAGAWRKPRTDVGAPDERADVVAAGREGAREVSAREAGRPGD
jgi:hypothetical protein